MTGPAAKKAAVQKKSDVYTVAGPLIQVVVGSQLLQYSFGDVLPAGIDENALKHLTENGLVQKGEAAVSDAELSDDQ